MVTKAEQAAELRKLGVDVDPKDHSQAELQDMIDTERARVPEFEPLEVQPGDAVVYCLTADHAAALTAREARFSRFMKTVAPFEPRVYSEGDAMYGRVFSSYDDGTASIDLLGSFPRFTLDRVEQGDGVGQFQLKE